MAQFVGVKNRPDISAPVNLLAPGNDSATYDGFKAIKRAFKHHKDTSTSGLSYTVLNI